VHYTLGPLNNLFGTARGLDGNVSLQLQGQASLFSERSAAGRDALIYVGDQRTMRSILTTTPLEDCDGKVYRRPDFMFGDAAPDPNHQLLVGEGQWIFNLDGEKYYLLSSKRHFPLSFFQCVTKTRKMQWQVTRITDSVHVGKLIASPFGYTRVGPPRCILGLHPGNVLLDIPVGGNPAVAQTFGNQLFKARGNYPATNFRTPRWIHPPKAWWRDLTLYVLAHLKRTWRDWDFTRLSGQPVTASR